MAATGKSAECFQTMAGVGWSHWGLQQVTSLSRTELAPQLSGDILACGPLTNICPLHRTETGAEFPLLTQKPQEPAISSGENAGLVALASTILPVRTPDVQGTPGADAHPAHPSRPTP